MGNFSLREKNWYTIDLLPMFLNLHGRDTCLLLHALVTWSPRQYLMPTPQHPWLFHGPLCGQLVHFVWYWNSKIHQVLCNFIGLQSSLLKHLLSDQQSRAGASQLLTFKDEVSSRIFRITWPGKIHFFPGSNRLALTDSSTSVPIILSHAAVWLTQVGIPGGRTSEFLICE